MSKDTPINDLPGISPSAIVQLSRIGVATAGDLLKADYDQIAVLLDCFHDADRLLDEARKLVPPETPAAPVRRSSRPRGPRYSKPEGAPPPPAPPPSVPSTFSEHRTEAPAPSPAASAPPDAEAARLPDALAFASRGLRVSQPEERASLTLRLSAAALLLSSNAEEREVMAALLLEAHEAGTLSVEEASERFGAKVASVLDECASLRAVPMSPSGRVPRLYNDMAGRASRSARRVCAALQLCVLSNGTPQPEGAAWYSRLLAEALSSAGDDELVSRLRAAVGLSKAA